MSKELLLEIGTEEIPSVYLNPVFGKIEEISKKFFSEGRVSYSHVKAFGTPRRLVLLIENLSERQEGVVNKVMGPPKKVAFDEKGSPTKAAIGFAKNQGVSVEDLKFEKTEKGEYLCAVKEEKGEETKKILPDILNKLILAIPFPKYMKWGEGSFKFVRPVHWILCLYNGSVVKFSLDNVQSGNKSFGHRFLNPKSFTVKDFASYRKKTKDNFVIFDQSERRDIILKQASELARQAGGNLHEDPNLLDAVTNLIEYPCSILGEFEEEYLKLPKEVLVSVMKKHQRYFPIISSNGSLLSKFIAISNNKVANPDIVKAGYERVIRARFSDARFFYEEDRKRHIQYYTEKLKSVVFEDKLGTYGEKVERVVKLTSYLAEKINPQSKEIAERGALLCKADLVTQMVYEFPELQGIMGREYALLSGEKAEIANVVYEHYLPKFVGDKLPESHAGDIVSIADKIDTIAGCFGIGLIPTGSEDPYALRRQTLAIINIILGKGYEISLSDIVNKAIEVLGRKIENKDAKEDIIEFFKSRFKNQLISDGIPYDVVDAVFSAKFDYICDDIKRIKALSEIKSLPYFEPLAIVFKRAANLVLTSIKSGIVKEDSYGMPDPELFKEDAERLLYESFNNIKSDAEALIKEKRYLDALKKITEIRGSVDRFFDEVMIMVDDNALRENRLKLLSGIVGIFSQLADFTKIVITK